MLRKYYLIVLIIIGMVSVSFAAGLPGDSKKDAIHGMYTKLNQVISLTIKDPSLYSIYVDAKKKVRKAAQAQENLPGLYHAKLEDIVQSDDAELKAFTDEYNFHVLVAVDESLDSGTVKKVTQDINQYATLNRAAGDRVRIWKFKFVSKKNELLQMQEMMEQRFQKSEQRWDSRFKDTRTEWTKLMENSRQKWNQDLNRILNENKVEDNRTPVEKFQNLILGGILFTVLLLLYLLFRGTFKNLFNDLANNLGESLSTGAGAGAGPQMMQQMPGAEEEDRPEREGGGEAEGSIVLSDVDRQEKIRAFLNEQPEMVQGFIYKWYYEDGGIEKICTLLDFIGEDAQEIYAQLKPVIAESVMEAMKQPDVFKPTTLENVIKEMYPKVLSARLNPESETADLDILFALSGESLLTLLMEEDESGRYLILDTLSENRVNDLMGRLDEGQKTEIALSLGRKPEMDIETQRTLTTKLVEKATKLQEEQEEQAAKAEDKSMEYIGSIMITLDLKAEKELLDKLIEQDAGLIDDIKVRYFLWSFIGEYGDAIVRNIFNYIPSITIAHAVAGLDPEVRGLIIEKLPRTTQQIVSFELSKQAQITEKMQEIARMTIKRSAQRLIDNRTVNLASLRQQAEAAEDEAADAATVADYETNEAA